MSDDPREEFLRLVDNQAGDSFRAAASYGPDDWTLLYVRDDVATDDLRDVLSTLLRRAREYEPIVSEDSYAGIGATEATVELHEDAALIHFPEGDAEGVVISLDRDVAQGLGQFVSRCTAVLAEPR